MIYCQLTVMQVGSSSNEVQLLRKFCPNICKCPQDITRHGISLMQRLADDISCSDNLCKGIMEAGCVT